MWSNFIVNFIHLSNYENCLIEEKYRQNILKTQKSSWVPRAISIKSRTNSNRQEQKNKKFINISKVATLVWLLEFILPSSSLHIRALSWFIITKSFQFCSFPDFHDLTQKKVLLIDFTCFADYLFAMSVNNTWWIIQWSYY